MKTSTRWLACPVALLFFLFQNTVTADLLMWWSFDEEAGSDTVIDRTGNGHDGDLMNFDFSEDSDLEPDAGKFGGAVHFDGFDDYVFNTTGFQPGGTAFTYAYFFKPDEPDYTVGHVRDDHIYSNARPHFSFSRDGGGDGQLGMYFTMNGDTQVKSATSEWANDTWHHVAWTFDGETVRMFVNGVEEGFEERAGEHTVQGDGRFSLGSNAGNNPYDGYMDDLTVWDETLPASDLLSLTQVGAEAFLDQRNLDTDGDGLPDLWEQAIIDADAGDAITELADVATDGDFDNDGSSNEAEFNRGTNPVNPDTDNDGLPDGAETNTDQWESVSMTGTAPRNSDSDGDGLSDGVENPDLPFDPANPETQPGTNPNLADTDQDGWPDRAELGAGTDPTDSASAPAVGQRLLFVGANPDPSHTGDPAAMAFFQERYGELAVDYVQASAVQPGDELEYGVLILSSSPGSGNMRGKFQDSPIPILNWEEALARNAAGEFAVTDGRLRDVSEHSIVIKEEHPITAGFEVGSTVDMTEGDSDFWWSTEAQAPGSLSLACDDDDENSLFLTIVEEGAELLDGRSAAGRRVMLGVTDNGFNTLTEDGFTLVGQAIDWLLGIADGGPQVPSIISVAADDGVRIDFATPQPESPHVLEQSVSLMPGIWQMVADATLESVGDLFRFTAVKPAGPANHYRVGMLPPPPLFTTDFEDGAEGWTATTTAGTTEWELGTPAASNLTTARSGVNAYGTDLDALYGDGVMASLRTPVIDLTDAGRPRLSFWYVVDATEDAEGVQLRILDETGGEPALFVHDEIFWGTTGDWAEFTLTIPTEARDRKIIIEWLLLTDGNLPNGEGLFLDDVTVD